jgi:hypothetical protein
MQALKHLSRAPAFRLILAAAAAAGLTAGRPDDAGARQAGNVPLPRLTNQCVAATPADRARTTVGVGEQVSLGLADAPPGDYAWSVSAGSVSNDCGTSATFTAPSNAANATVTVTLPGGQTLSRNFTVLEPGGVDHADLLSVYDFDTNESGAGMYCRVYLAPTNVSFYRVQLMEVATNASGITGYYADPANSWDPPEDLRDFQANVWFQINEDNSWQHNGQDDGTDYDRAWWADDNPPWSLGGSLTWNYTAQWKIGTGPANRLPASWSQQVILDSEGTITVRKFGHTLTRNTNNIYTTKQ